MEAYFEILKLCPLFDGITKEETARLLPCLKARIAQFKKGEIIIAQSSHPDEAGIIISGRIQGIKTGYNGNLQIISNLGAGELFGDALVSTSSYPSPVNVVAAADTTAVMISCEALLSGCANACRCHDLLRKNLLNVIAGKFWALNRKLGYITINSLRERIATFIMDCSQGKATFTIPFDRANMAGYLGADRSALSRELSRMKCDGLIEYYKNSFKIIDLNKLKAAARI